MAKCKYCHGTGTRTYFTGDGATVTDCVQCKGTGYINMTHEDWFDTLSTKEKAKWLDKVAENCCQICDEENRELCRGNIATGCKFENAKKWELWLKQPYKKEQYR